MIRNDVTGSYVVNKGRVQSIRLSGRHKRVRCAVSKAVAVDKGVVSEHSRRSGAKDIAPTHRSAVGGADIRKIVEVRA